MTATAHTANNAADTAAEAIRTLNHATRHISDFTIGDLYRILGDLATMTHRLPQTCDQITAILNHHEHRLEHDDGGYPQETVARAGIALSNATAAAITLAHDLDQAHQSTASLRPTIED
jgi:hypothetical protein